MDTTNERRSERIALMTDELPVLRAVLRISQAELAREIGISRQTYSLIETGKQQMTWVTYMALIAYFGNIGKTRKALISLGLIEDTLR